MWSGFKEILLVIVVLVALFLLPRMLRGRGKQEQQAQRREGKRSGWLRLGLFASLMWLGLCSFFFNPFSGALAPFLGFGVFPVVAVWGGAWVWLGFKK